MKCRILSASLVLVAKMRLTPQRLVLFGVAFILTVTAENVEEEPSARIVNGFAVDVSEVPYQAALRRRSIAGWAHMCGAIVITVQTVLTAGHCGSLYVSQPSLLRLVVGTSYRLSGGTTYDIFRIYVHEGYTAETLENDIALMVTSKKFSFSKNVQSVQLASPNFYSPAGTEAIVSGYGTTSYEGSASSQLLATRVKILEQDSCSRAYLRIAAISSGMLCANATNPARDACQGDSGGPLVYDQHLIGIVSWGEGCADQNYPGVYTRVSAYYSWIQQKLASSYN